ncbi:MAG: hypothetical protein HY805_08760 [Nitrospirae bacterium]|nr:hypothetical protein [Nitrospirota bacterium]
MKRLVIVLLLVFCATAWAQPEEQKGQMKGMKGEEMPMMQMMNQMMGQQMMMQEQMQEMAEMMDNMLDVQEQMMTAEKGARKKLMKEMAQMRKKMKQMMSRRMGMMGMGMMGQPFGQMKGKMQCIEEWLKKAIDLHEIHIKDPQTATAESQLEMMEMMKKAYECITPCPMCMMPMEKPDIKEETPGKDPHGH